MPLPKVKYWSSSPLIAGQREHIVLLTVKQGEEEKTARVATACNSVVAQRIAQLLDKDDGR